MKKCSRCAVFKDESAYAKGKTVKGRPHALQNYCRECASAYHAAYRLANADKRAKWFEENRVRMRELSSAWGKENRERQNAKNALRHATKLMATPAWADLEAIRSVYADAAAMGQQTGIPHQVDHIVPLRGKTVCGLHCEANLQVLTALDNLKKLNRHWPDMPDDATYQSQGA